MSVKSFLSEIEFNPSKPSVQLILETAFTKEIRISFLEGQLMKEHKSSFPIIIQVLTGNISLTVDEEKLELSSGDLISLAGNIPHSLFANSQSIVRLSLIKQDEFERVQNAVNNS
ncbi:MAG TPA: cupin domain-containing protein [Saprospiraceae bacterium]|nr:cupin domain-containing protein [Saprospiraceae bacterium]